MTTPPNQSNDPRDPSFYGEHYYAQSLHRRHWFKDNEAKHRLRLQAIVGMLELEPTDRLLDLGCADGAHSLALRPLVAEVTGVDFSTAAVEIACKRAAGTQGIQFLRADVADLRAIASQSVDKVAAIDLVEHIPDETLEAMLAEVWRVLKPGGRFAFYTPNASHYVERLKAAGVLRQLPGHISVRVGTAYERALARHPWQDARVSYLPSSYPVLGHLERVLMRLPWVAPLFRFRIVGVARKP